MSLISLFIVCIIIMSKVIIDFIYEFYQMLYGCHRQAFLPLLKKAASTSADVSGLSCSRAAIVNISTKVASIDDNKSGGGYPYRASKVHISILWFLTISTIIQCFDAVGWASKH